MIGAWLLAAAAATAQPAPTAPPQGFNAEALAQRLARSDAASAEARERAAETDLFRAGFTLDPARAWATLSNNEAETLHRALGPERGWEAAELAWFMRGAAVRVAGEDLAGLYNPVADVWLLLRWERAGGGLRIVEAALVPGASVRPAAEAGAWTGSGALYGIALAEADALAAVRFVQLPGSVGSDLLFSGVAEARNELRGRAHGAIRRWVGGLAAWSSDPARRSAWAALHRRLLDGGSGAGAAARLPTQVRASLTPVAAIDVHGAPSLLLVSPLYPSLYVTADFPAGVGARAELNILNLANAAPPGGSEEGVRR